MDNNPFRTTNGIQPQQTNPSNRNEVQYNTTPQGQVAPGQSTLNSAISVFDPMQRNSNMTYLEQPHQQANQYSNPLSQNNAMFSQQHNSAFPAANAAYMQQGLSPPVLTGANMPFNGHGIVGSTYSPHNYGQTDFGSGFMLQPQYSNPQPQQQHSYQQIQQLQEPKYRHAPVDASSLLQSRVVRCVECPVCHKTIEGDDPAINHHVNDHYS